MDRLLDIINLYFLNLLMIMMGFHYFNRFLGRKVSWFHYIFFGMAVLALEIFSTRDRISFTAGYIILFWLDGILADKMAVWRYRKSDARQGSITIFFHAFVTVVVIHLCNGIVNSLCGIFAPIVSFSTPFAISFFFVSISFVLSFSLILLCFNLIAWCSQEEEGQKIYALLFLFPILLILLVSEYIGSELSGSTVIIESGRTVNATDQRPLLLLQVLGTASLLGILYAYHKLQEGFRLQKEMCLLKQESHFQQQYVEEAKMRYEKTRSFRHDIQNHIMVLEEMLQQRELASADHGEAAQRYLGNMKKLTDELAFPVSTCRPVLDILLENKIRMAESTGIETKCSLKVPEICEISDMDLCIILSNAVDNAITACSQMSDRGERFIHITSSQQGGFLMIQVVNSYDGKEEIRWDTGLGNIRAAAEKYQGAMEIQAEEGVFALNVLIGNC